MDNHYHMRSWKHDFVKRFPNKFKREYLLGNNNPRYRQLDFDRCYIILYVCPTCFHCLYQFSYQKLYEEGGHYAMDKLVEIIVCGI